MTEIISLPFDHVKAHEHITRKDKRMARVIAKTGAFQFQLDQCDSVYESLLEAIAYQSISGKAAATIFARIKALGSNGLLPHACGNSRGFESDAARSGTFRRESRGDERPRAEND